MRFYNNIAGCLFRVFFTLFYNPLSARYCAVGMVGSSQIIAFMAGLFSVEKIFHLDFAKRSPDGTGYVAVTAMIAFFVGLSYFYTLDKVIGLAHSFDRKTLLGKAISFLMLVVSWAVPIGILAILKGNH